MNTHVTTPSIQPNTVIAVTGLWGGQDRAGQSRIEQGRAGQSRIEQGRADLRGLSRAEQGRVNGNRAQARLSWAAFVDSCSQIAHTEQLRKGKFLQLKKKKE